MRLTGSPSRSGSSVVGIAPSAHYQGGSHHAWPNRIGLDRYCWCLSQIPTQLQMIRVAHLPATPIRCSCQRGDPRLTGPVTEVNRRSHLSSFVPSAPNVLLHGSYRFLGQRSRTKAVPTVVRLPALSLRRGPSFVQAKDGGCGIHSFPFPCGPSMRTPQALAISDRQQRIATRMRESHASMPLDEIGRGAGDPGKLAKTPGLNQDKISN